MKFLFASVILCVSLGAATSTCPPEGFDSVKDFVIEDYIRASWYIQEQRPLIYQPESSLFCVVATYELENPDDVTEGLRVFNYANDDGVNGDSPAEGVELRAVIPDPDDPSKLAVGFGLLEDIFGGFATKLFGDYWVVAVGPVSDPEVGYDWAIVSGGAPTLETPGGCRTGRRFFSNLQTNDIGLWLFSRKPVDPIGAKKMRKVAEDLGFDLSVLLPVQQKGCLYEGAFIK